MSNDVNVDVTLKIQEEVFSSSAKSPDSNETSLGSSIQEAAPSAEKKYWGSFSAILHIEKCPYSFFRWRESFQCP